MLTVSQFLSLVPSGLVPEHSCRPRVRCASGLTLSIQAGEYLYSTPRSEQGPYTEVEVGYPSKVLTELEKYCGQSQSIYAYVPVEELELVIAANGGIVGLCKMG